MNTEDQISEVIQAYRVLADAAERVWVSAVPVRAAAPDAMAVNREALEELQRVLYEMSNPLTRVNPES